MAYISNGKVEKDAPWSIQRLIGFFWGLIAFFMYFFKTLFGFEASSGSNFRSGGGSGGRQGPGNGPGGGFKRMGRITTIDDHSMPGGGCCGGGCPR